MAGSHEGTQAETEAEDAPREKVRIFHCVIQTLLLLGRLSMHIDAVVRSGSHEFSDASEIVRYCELKLTIDNDKSGMCCHWQHHYFEVSN